MTMLEFVNGCVVDTKCKFVPGSARLNTEICKHFVIGTSKSRCFYAKTLGKCNHPVAIRLALEEKLKALNSLERKSSGNVSFRREL
jgi:hypothetical protein